MILSVDTQSIWQNPTSISEFKKKKNTLPRLEIEENFLKLIMKICEKPTTNITHNDERKTTFSLRSEIRLSAPVTCVQHCTGGTGNAIQQKKGTKVFRLDIRRQMNLTKAQREVIE